MKRNNPEILSSVANYYSSKLADNGETARGVDWNGEESQLLRFDQLCRVITESESVPISINDLGCGYGAMWPYLQERYAISLYTGIDVSADMIKVAKRRYEDVDCVEFMQSEKPSTVGDYTIASGIFNVRLDVSCDAWWSYMEETISLLDAYSRKGFAFNCLTSYSDADKMRDYLYYADPCKVFDFCKRSFSRNVAVLHDYDLYEFTILVRKVV